MRYDLDLHRGKPELETGPVHMRFTVDTTTLAEGFHRVLCKKDRYCHMVIYRYRLCFHRFTDLTLSAIINVK